MGENHAELSDKCKAAIVEKIVLRAKILQPSFASRHERCLAYVQQTNRYRPKQSATPALERCMHGEPIPAAFNEKEVF
jgi:hypothetical protein